MKKAVLASLVVISAAACGGAEEAGQAAGSEMSWEAMSVHSEASNTHLWIVDRAIDVLGKHPEHSRAKAARALMKDPACTPQWQQGLFDADYRHEYNNGRRDLVPGASVAVIAASGASWKSHFFDPDSRENYLGETTPTALTEALSHLASARRLVKSNRGNACYELGLSLHYLTDLTQPMHAANFTATDRPRQLHTNLEEWSMKVQGSFALADWSAAPSGAVDALIITAARTSKAAWRPMWEVIADAYEVSSDTFNCGSLRTPAWDVTVSQQLDHVWCWESAAPVKAAVGQSLRRAQDTTARYLALVGGLD